MDFYTQYCTHRMHAPHMCFYETGSERKQNVCVSERNMSYRSKPKPETYTLNKVGRASWGEVKNEGSSTESTPSFPLSETKIGKDWKGLCAYTQSLPILSRHSTLKSPRNPWARGGKRLVTAGSTPAVVSACLLLLLLQLLVLLILLCHTD